MKMIPVDKAVIVTADIKMGSDTFRAGAVGLPHLHYRGDKAASKILFDHVEGVPAGAMPLYESTWLEAEEAQGKYKLVDKSEFASQTWHEDVAALVEKIKAAGIDCLTITTSPNGAAVNFATASSTRSGREGEVTAFEETWNLDEGTLTSRTRTVSVTK